MRELDEWRRTLIYNNWKNEKITLSIIVSWIKDEWDIVDPIKIVNSLASTGIISEGVEECLDSTQQILNVSEAQFSWEITQLLNSDSMDEYFNGSKMIVVLNQNKFYKIKNIIL